MSFTPSQRIKILKEVSTRLSDAEWPEIDLVLTQFLLPTQSVWNGDKSAYFLEMSKNASDEVLNGLSEHFELPSVDSGTRVVLQPSFWKDGAFKIFVSHLAIHHDFAGELQDNLSKFGISAFVAHNDIEPAAEWQIEIEKALATCDSLVALLHSDFHKSNWTDQEIGFAMGRGIPIFAVRLGQDPYGFIGKFQAFNGLGRALNAIALDIFNAYRKHKQTKEKMAEALIGLFEQSASFEAAKIRMGYLDELDVWKPSFASRLTAAIKNNSQVSGSWGVPKRIEVLINKWDSNTKKTHNADLESEMPF